MSSSAIREAIKATLETVEGIGRIYERERPAKSLNDVKQIYGISDGTMRGAFVRREGFIKKAEAEVHDYVITTNWEIHFFSSFVDASDSETVFDALVDEIDAAFRADPLLDGAVEATVTPQQAGISLVSSKPAMLHGVLVHYAILTLQTEHSESP